jgi:glucose 1-dehydrogenase
MIDLSGRVALITGASRGIGRGCAMEMAKAGADVVVNYNQHPEDAAEVVGQVEKLGRRAVAIKANVGERPAVDRLVRTALDQFGKIDILVNNAYRSIRKPFLDLTDEDVEATWAVSLWGVFRCSQAVARHMVERRQGGKIIVISSVLSFIPIPTSLAYNTAKAGINQMAHTMATELAPHRIHVNVIEPGWTDTPGERQFATEEQIQEGGKKLPLGRLGRSDEIGKMATFLASDAADYITGGCFRVDGGVWLPGGLPR